MSFSYGFFDNIDGIPAYNAEDINNILIGIISDGVYNRAAVNGSNLYNRRFEVTRISDLKVNVAPGKAMFHNIWIINDDDLPINLTDVSNGYSRYTDIVIEVNKNIDVRNATIKAVDGTQKTIGTTPTRPTLFKDDFLAQYPLSTVLIKKQNNAYTMTITSCIGTIECPYISNLLKVPGLNIVNDVTETDTGSCLDARQGKALDDKIATLNGSIDTTNRNITTLNNSITSLNSQISSYFPFKFDKKNKGYGFYKGNTFQLFI